MDVDALIEEIRGILRGRGDDDSVMFSTESYSHEWVAMACNDCNCVRLGEEDGRYEAHADTLADALAKLLANVKNDLRD